MIKELKREQIAVRNERVKRRVGIIMKKTNQEKI